MKVNLTAQEVLDSLLGAASAGIKLDQIYIVTEHFDESNQEMVQNGAVDMRFNGSDFIFSS